jgi:hypothetical protein
MEVVLVQVSRGKQFLYDIDEEQYYITCEPPDDVKEPVLQIRRDGDLKGCTPRKVRRLSRSRSLDDFMA